MSYLKKIILGFSIVSLGLFLSVDQTQAKTETCNTGVLPTVSWSMAQMIFGCEGIRNAPPPETCATPWYYICTEPDVPSLETHLGANSPDSEGAVLQLTRLNTQLAFSQPASSVTYVADLMQQVGPRDQAYAQGVGIGFASLTPILGIWKAFRNIAYFFFALAFIVVGLAIIFRAKINPQTVVNLQLALPQLVITLILITFSYAIAGFLIDIMYLIIYLVIGVLSLTVFTESGGRAMLSDVAFSRTFPHNVMVQLFGSGHDGEGSNFFAGMTSMVAQILGFDPDGWSLTDPMAILTNLLAGAGGVVFGVIFILVFGVVIIWKSLQIFFSLLTAYIKLILLIITAPLRLLLNVYPGSNAFTSWLKEIVSELAVFPTVIFMLFLAMALMGQGTGEGIGYGSGDGAGFVPPQLLFDGTDAIQALLGIGVLLAIPQVLESVKGFFGVGGQGGGGGGGFGAAAAGGAFGGVLGGMAAPFRAAGGMGMSMYKGAALTKFYDNVDATGSIWGGMSRTARQMANPMNVVGGSDGQGGLVDYVRDQKARNDYMRGVPSSRRVDQQTPTVDNATTSQNTKPNEGSSSNEADSGGA